MTFTGFPAAALDFYEDLEADNSKAFWTAHKDTYEGAIKKPFEALVAELGPEFGEAKIFRPYRDVRFAKDKSPYKTNQGAWFGESSVYVHIDAAGLMVAAGYWETASDQVGRLREAVAAEISGTELEGIIADLEQAGFEVGGEQLTRVPAGYPKDHPRADRLRFKTLTARKTFGAPAWLATPKAKKHIVDGFHAMQPLTSWLQQRVGPTELERRGR
ncbi:DUF2461 domain-containing protein [Smaragdicoccus niigatensis]|uniref:DUF2461 domain-containing protein n=1 Tax=Smaragdicoccus niigatensis TaxID=359359 RepID=UPI00036AF36F|nr:DUF2461 domain-containing protein [Smaragdicoccus niigatensis]